MTNLLTFVRTVFVPTTTCRYKFTTRYANQIMFSYATVASTFTFRFITHRSRNIFVIEHLPAIFTFAFYAHLFTIHVFGLMSFKSVLSRRNLVTFRMLTDRYLVDRACASSVVNMILPSLLFFTISSISLRIFSFLVHRAFLIFIPPTVHSIAASSA